MAAPTPGCRLCDSGPITATGFAAEPRSSIAGVSYRSPKSPARMTEVVCTDDIPGVPTGPVRVRRGIVIRTESGPIQSRGSAHRLHLTMPPAMSGRSVICVYSHGYRCLSGRSPTTGDLKHSESATMPNTCRNGLGGAVEIGFGVRHRRFGVAGYLDSRSAGREVGVRIVGSAWQQMLAILVQLLGPGGADLCPGTLA